MGLVHFRLTLDEHRAQRGGYVDPARYAERSRDYRPEMLCRTGDGHAQGVRGWDAVTCPACRSARGQPLRREVGNMGDEGKPGEILTMLSGERWFHPYGGGAPKRLPDDSFFEPLREAGRRGVPLAEIGRKAQ